MRQITRIFCCMTAVMLLALPLTACGGTDYEASAAMGGYADKAEDAAANTIASTLYQAAQSALRDIDTEDVDISMLSGDYTFRSSDLTSAAAPQMIVNPPDALAKLFSSMQIYIDKNVAFDKGIISVKDGDCQAVAVQTDAEYDQDTGETVRQFGCYPNALKTGDSFEKLEDVIAHAKS